MKQAINEIVARALAEDIGKGDITSLATLPKGLAQSFRFVAREELVVCGLEVMREVFRAVDKNVKLTCKVKEGAKVKKGAVIAEVKGKVSSILTAERVALNLMQRLSGVATVTRQYVDAVKGTRAIILDTRKTMPGMRELDKYAVRVGGAQNHRMRLDDGVLIKDNHILACGSVAKAVASAKRYLKGRMKITVECDTLVQVKQALAAGADRLLLDNMSTVNLKKAVALVNRKVKLEASGGVTLKNVREVAKTGVDYIAIGALTHSVRAVDIGLD